MAQNNGNASSDVEGEDPNVKKALRKSFAEAIYSRMVAKGWSQSELGRRSGVSRDNISKYINGRSIPERPRVEKLAAALGCKPEDLLPAHAAWKYEKSVAALEMRMLDHDPGRVFLKISQEISTEKAVKIMAILQEKD